MHATPYPDEPQSALRRLTLKSSSLLLCVMALSGCLSEPTPPKTQLWRVEPELIEPRGEAQAVGRGLELLPSPLLASVGGQPVRVTARTTSTLTLSFPERLPNGAQLLALSANGALVAELPVYVEGGSAPLPPPPPPPLPDTGPLPPEPSDMGLLDMTPPVDQGPPLEWRAAYTPEREGAEVGLEPTLMRGEGGRLELWVRVTLIEALAPQLWGIATHLTFPEGRLRFIGTREEQTYELKASTSLELPGRVLLYRANVRGEVMILGFEVLDPPETFEALPPFSLSFVSRFSGLRDNQRQPKAASWSGGEVRYVSNP